MHSKGIFSFIILIIMMLIILELNVFLTKENNEFEKIKNELMIIENASKERVIMEENVDKIINFILEKNVGNNTTNIFLVRNEINSNLFNYLKNRAKATNIFGEKEKDLTLNFLNENSVVSIIKIDGITYSEYSFTSDITKTNIVNSKLGNNLILEYRIPIDYIMRVVK
jgi:hypothetical protein